MLLEGFFVVHSLLNPDVHGILHLSEMKFQDETRLFCGGEKNQLCCFEVIAKYDISRSLRSYTSKSCLERPNHT